MLYIFINNVKIKNFYNGRLVCLSASKQVTIEAQKPT